MTYTVSSVTLNPSIPIPLKRGGQNITLCSMFPDDAECQILLKSIEISQSYSKSKKVNVFKISVMESSPGQVVAS